MSGKLAGNSFVGNIKLIVKTNGDGIGFNFGDFTIWKNTNHDYFIVRNDGKYWTGAGGWIKNSLRRVMYANLNEALNQVDELFGLKKYE